MELKGAFGAEEDNGHLFWGNTASFLSEEFFFFFFKWRVGKVAGGRRLPQQSMHRHKRIEFDCDKKCTMAAAEVGEEAANVFGRAPSTQ